MLDRVLCLCGEENIKFFRNIEIYSVCILQKLNKIQFSFVVQSRTNVWVKYFQNLFAAKINLIYKQKYIVSIHPVQSHVIGGSFINAILNTLLSILCLTHKNEVGKLLQNYRESRKKLFVERNEREIL